MKNPKVTCLTWTAVFLVLTGVSAWFVHRRAPFGGAALFGGLIGGVLLVIVLAWVSAIGKRMLEWWRIVGARFGRQPRDGHPAAIIGTLRGHGELQAPFSRERCVLYSYEMIITDIVDGESQERKAYEGFAMVPLSIEHGAERTRILAKPELPSLEAKWRRSRNAESAAKLFVENTTFTPKSMPFTPKSTGLMVKNAAIGAKSPEEKDLAQTDGHLRYDYSNEPIETNVGACRLMEKILPPETNVCVLGTYRADRHALVAPVTLRTGASFGIDAAWRVVNAGIATAIFAAIAIIAAAFFCANFPIEMAERAESRLAWWEINLERFVDRNVRAPLAARGMMTSTGYYLFDVCEGCASGRLEINGRTIDLKHATYLGGRTIHLSARKGDRDGVTLVDDRVVLTIDGKAANVPPSWMQENDIETSLGSEGEYAGRITVIAPDGWIRCRVTFNTRVDDNAWLPSRR
ncbi:MAG TPA: hypothetical protein VGF48_14920 [Thermoanaerobaculia bacterium]